MLVLPDTSVWVEFLREGKAGSAAELDHLLRRASVVVCGPVVAELLAGASDSDRTELWIVLSDLPWADLDRADWRDVGEIAAALRHRGRSVALTDVVIAVAAVRVDAALWTRDRDFERVRSVLSALQIYRPRRR